MPNEQELADILNDNTLGVTDEVQDDTIQIDEGETNETDLPDGNAETTETEEAVVESPVVEAEEAEEVETWLLDDKQEDDRTIPLDDHITLRQKLKNEKRDLQDKVDHLERQARVKSEIEPRPTLEQFEFDKDKYDRAMDEWYDHRIASQIDRQLQSKKQDELKQSVKRGSDAHYQRAATMLNKNKLAPEKYRDADANIRNVLQEVTGNGDVIADAIVGFMGKGSEKVFWMVGRSADKLQEFRTALLEDASGMKAALYLGKQLEIANKVVKVPKKKRIEPAPQVTGGSAVTPTSAGKLHKSYNSMTDPQKKWDLRKKAKAKGVDVSDW